MSILFRAAKLLLSGENTKENRFFFLLFVEHENIRSQAPLGIPLANPPFLRKGLQNFARRPLRKILKAFAHSTRQ